MLDPLSGQIHDFFNGQNDLLEGTLRHTSEAFKDDPLRVLRGMQFCGRFNLSAAQETIKMSNSLKSEFETLPTERIFSEFSKWARKSTNPSKGLDFMQACGWLDFFPQIESWEKIDEFAGKGEAIVFAALFSDSGAAKSFMAQIGAPKKLAAKVEALVANKNSKANARQLSHDLGKASIREWVALTGNQEMLQEAVREGCADSPQAPFLQGRDLIAQGHKPGPGMGKTLRTALKAQLSGQINSREDALEWSKTQ